MRIAAIIVFLLCSVLCSAQDYIQYYEGINQAKLSLLEDSFEDALDIYFETFEIFDFVFARDVFNALEVATASGDLDKTDYFLRRCLQQGVELDLLEQDTILNAFKKTDAWPKILLDRDSLRSIYEGNVNWELRNEINGMFAQDQQIRDLADKNRFNIFKLKKLNKEFEEVDHKLVLRLVEITKEYGFPGEILIGLDAASMHPKITEEKLTTGMPIVILIHHYSQPNLSYNALFLDEIAKGNLFNEHFATISDFQYAYGKLDNRDSLCYSQMFTPKLDVELIDRNRKGIHLLPVSQTNALKRKRLVTPKYYLY